MNDKIEDRMEVQRVSIDWYRSAPWWRLGSHTIALSWRMSHIVTGLLAVWLIRLEWQLAGWLFVPKTATETGLRFGVPSSELMGILQFFLSGQRMPKELNLTGVAFWLFGILGTIAIGCFFGGLLARRSTVELGTQSSIGWGSVFQTVKKRYLSLFMTTLMPWLFLLGLLLFATVIGVIGRIPFISVLVNAVVPPLFVLFVILVGFLAVKNLFAIPLAIVAVVTEKNADAFDGVSRSAAYLRQKPLTVGLLIGLGLVVARVLIALVLFALTFGIELVGNSFAMGNGGASESSLLLQGYLQSSVEWVLAGFLFSFFWSGFSAIYLILRSEVDHTDYDEMEVDSPTFEPPPAESQPNSEPSPSSVSSPSARDASSDGGSSDSSTSSASKGE